MNLNHQKNYITKYFLIFLVGVFALTFFNLKAATKNNINNYVPFASQAPLGEWSDPRQQDGCEEAAVLMSLSWTWQIPNYSQKMWRDKITNLADWQQKNYGEHRDTALDDIISRIFLDHFVYDQVSLKKIKNPADIIAELEAGNLVIAPTNGQVLKNPNFTGLGPERHMVLVKGYDYLKNEFITNDPGTRNGADYRYPADRFFEAIRSYKTGYHEAF